MESMNDEGDKQISRAIYFRNKTFKCLVIWGAWIFEYPV